MSPLTGVWKFRHQEKDFASELLTQDTMNSFLRRLLCIGFLWASIVISCACTAHKQPSTTETNLANIAKDIVIPIQAKDLKNPVPATPEVLKDGQQLFLQSCAICHGTDGHGRTTLGRAMYPPAMDLTSPHVQHWEDAELYWIIQNGVRLTGMASWKDTITPADTWKLVDFVHHLPEMDAAAAMGPGKGPETTRTQAQLIAYGKVLYRQEGCFMCHQLNGTGGKAGPDLTVEGTRGRTAEWLMGHFKNPPAYTKGSIMPPFKNLTDEQLNALTTFLLNQKGAEQSKR
jgi:mono/diheme cytochrome c family protein